MEKGDDAYPFREVEGRILRRGERERAREMVVVSAWGYNVIVLVG